MALERQVVTIPLSQGVDTKQDPRAMKAPGLLVCENAVFDDVGGIQKRPGSAAEVFRDQTGASIQNPTALGVVDDQLLAFANGRLYSQPVVGTNKRWDSKGKFDSAKSKEDTVAFGSSSPTCDMATLSGVALYAWEDPIGGVTPRIVFKLVDEATGSTFEVGAGTGNTGTISNGIMPKCRASSDRLHLYWIDTGNDDLVVLVINPLDVFNTTHLVTNTVIVGTDVRATVQQFDVVAIDSGATIVAAYNNTVTGYTLKEMNGSTGAVIGSSVKTRASDGDIAIAQNTSVASIVVVREATIAGPLDEVRVDWIVKASLADRPAGRIDILARPATNFVERFTVAVVDAGQAWVYVDRIDTGGTASRIIERVKIREADGTIFEAAVNFVRHSALASRAARLTINGVERVVVQVAYREATEQIRTQYVLIDGDTETGAQLSESKLVLLARTLPGEANNSIVKEDGLPQISGTTDSISWLAARRTRLATSGDNVALSKFSFKRIDHTFGDPSAFQGAQAGRTLYLPGGFLAAFDGNRVVESGFWVFPEVTDIITLASGGQLAIGTYSYRVYWEWYNERGERERSTAGPVVLATTTATNSSVSLSVRSLPYTFKSQGGISQSEVVLAVYRTEVGGGSVFYRASSTDPASSTYVTNAPWNKEIVWVDTEFGDSGSAFDITKNELDYQNSGEIDNVPPASFPKAVAVGQNRMFYVPASDPNTVSYSKLRFQGESLAFNEVLTTPLPDIGGDVVAVHPAEDAVLVFKQRAVFLLSGNGPNNLNVGGYGVPQLVLHDIGCSDARSVVRLPAGVMFKSEKGYYLLDLSYSASYVGAPVEDFNDRQVVAAITDADRHRVLFFHATGGTLAYDYATNQWSDWPGWAANSAAESRGSIYFMKAATVHREDSTVYQDSLAGYPLVVETAWIKFADLLGYSQVRWYELLGEWRDIHDLRVRVAYNYDDTWIDDDIWPPNNVAVGPLQLRRRFSQRKVSAVKFRIEDLRQGKSLHRESLRLTGIAVEMGIKSGVFRLPSAQTG